MSESPISDAPDWYRWAMAQPCEEGRVPVDGADIAWAAWGERGKPGLLLVTGNGAHLGWWRPIAPFLASTFRVATLSWSGMGGSDWRVAYTPDLFVAEAMAVAEVAGLFDADIAPILAGHSFGGILTMLTTVTQGERLRAAVLIDARLRTRSVWGVDAEASGPHRIYPTREDAIARFRLQPRQPERNRFILDALADEALGPAEGGWRWRADPDIRRKTELGSNLTDLIPQARCSLMFVRGALSTTASDEIWAEHKAVAPPGTPFIDIPDAYHHVMIDQPIALVATLRALFARLP
jgi:pimeloyl-ACP methyl ester carboxylesterase